MFISLLINAHRNNEDQVVVKDFELNRVTDIAFIVRTVGTKIKWLIHFFLSCYMSTFQLLLLQNKALKMSGMTGGLCEILAVFVCFAKVTFMLFTDSISHRTLLYIK